MKFTLKEWLNKLFKPKPKPVPEFIGMAKTFDLTGVRFKKVDSHYIRVALQVELLRLGFPKVNIGDMRVNDREYLLYPESTIKATQHLFAGKFYNHREWLKGKIKREYEGSDCDNHAEHRSYWFHYYLPACSVIRISGQGGGEPCHAFNCMLTLEGKWLWYSVVMEKKDYTKIFDISF